MIDIKLIRENPELVKENIKKKFQNEKLVLVDEVVELDKELRAAKLEADTLRGKRNSVSKSIGMLMAQKKIEEANSAKQEVVKINERLVYLEKEEVDGRITYHRKRISILPFMEWIFILVNVLLVVLLMIF